MVEAPSGFMGILDVFVHRARGIHDICIYEKQDVYAKLCLTSDPEVTVSTKTVHGGGANPVFDESFRLDVRAVEASLKCEIWMMSRIKNYLKDQMLGFTLVPLSVVVGNEKLAQEFPLSSTDLFHSRAGFVQLSLSYHGSSPEVMALPNSVSPDTVLLDSENCDSVLGEYVKMEFPDLKSIGEDTIMVSEYIRVRRTDSELKSTESLITSDNGNCPGDDVIGARIARSLSTPENSLDSSSKKDSPQSSVSTNVMASASHSLTDPSGVTTSAGRGISREGAECESDSSVGKSGNAIAAPVVSRNMDPDETIVQQDIVDMYMKSMQQFTETLAKMNLPMDIGTNGSGTESANLRSEQRSLADKGTASRVFYGSRAFF